MMKPAFRISAKRKGQIQMGESVAILFVFFILIVFGFVFYMKILGSSSQAEFQENIQLQAIGVAQRVSFLPELQCSRDNVRKENCIDLFKLSHIDEIVPDNQLHYFDLFGFSRVTVQQLFPSGGDLLIYENVPATFTDKLSTFIPTSLYDATTGNFNMGVLVVEVYS
jgi:hypothetical protein|tara:strand:- start:201 stop:701 length:501 start_codon:yes stop_codon:yes gene_type:complete